MANLSELRKATEFADAKLEKHILMSVFKYFDDFDQFVFPSKFTLLVGRKGCGKSAIFNYSERMHDELKFKSILVDPSDLLYGNVDTPPKADTVAEWVSFYCAALTRGIAAAIGKSVKFSFAGDEALAQARITGDKKLDTIEKLAKICSSIQFKHDWIPSVTLPASSQPNVVALKKRIADGDISRFQVYIDDIDQAGDFSTNTGLVKIYSLIMACRKMCSDIHGLNIIISLRYDLWYRIEKEPTGMFEIDKLRGSVKIFTPNDDQIYQMLLSWLKYARDNFDSTINSEPFSVYFAGKAILPNSSDERSWPAFLTTYSRQRPRDGIQLIHALATASEKAKRAIIDTSVVNKTLDTYSLQRVSDLEREFSFECKKIRDVIAHFSGAPWKMTYEELYEKLRTAPQIGDVAVRGIPLKPDDLGSAMKLLAYLYEIGFINPRIEDPSKPRGFAFLYHHEYPNLVQPENSKKIQTLSWHIHPAYRDFIKSCGIKW